MGRIVTPIHIENLQDPTYRLTLNVLVVDTAAAYLTLPTAWQTRLGHLRGFGELSRAVRH